MKPSTIRMSALAGALISFAALTGSASAEGIVNGNYRITLTDPANGAVYHTDISSIRSWPTKEQCEAQIKDFSSVHTKVMEQFKIMNASGAPLEVKIDSATCKVVREN